MARIDAFFRFMKAQGASDFHLAGSVPLLRIKGELQRIKYKELDDDELQELLLKSVQNINLNNLMKQATLILHMR